MILLDTLYRLQGHWVKHKLASRDLDVLKAQSLASPKSENQPQYDQTTVPIPEPVSDQVKFEPPPAVLLRLQQLADNIRQDLELLKEYEDTLRYETDPKTRAKYRREIEKLQESATSYQNDFAELSMEQVDSSVLDNLASQLQQMTVRLRAVDKSVQI